MLLVLQQPFLVVPGTNATRRATAVDIPLVKHFCRPYEQLAIRLEFLR